MIRLMSTDLDGTFLNPLHTLDPYLKDTIRTVKRYGIAFAIATGRTLVTNTEYGFDNLGVYGIGGNGAMIFDTHGQLIRSSVVDKNVIADLLHTFPDVAFELSSPTASYTRRSQEEFMRNKHHKNPLVDALLHRRLLSRAAIWHFSATDDEILADDICKINLHTFDEDIKRDMEAFLANHTDSLVNAPFMPHMYELTAKGVNKGEATAWLAQYLGFEEGEVAVFGDSGNDLAMLERFDMSFAPASASQDAQRRAKHVVGAYQTYAIPRAMRALATGKLEQIIVS